MKNTSIQKMVTSALLIAIGILIPLVSPAKIMMPPASFTLASHVPVFLAMLISPAMACSVAIGTTIGFFISSPLVIALRAATHVIFALLGGLYIQKRPATLESPAKLHVFSLVIGVIHAAGELIVVSLFYFGGGMGAMFYEQGFLRSVLLLVGLGSVIHSMVDFEIALVVYKVLSKQRGFAALTSRSY